MKVKEFIETRDAVKEIRFILMNTNEIKDLYQRDVLVEKLDRILAFIEKLLDSLL